MINIEEHRRFVFMLLERANIPHDIKDDTYQDFCVYYYSRNQEYNPDYALTTWISLLFKSFLSHRASRYNMKKRKGNLVDISVVEEMGYEEDNPEKIDASRLYDKLPDLFKTLLNTNKTPAIIAKEEGVTRQAIEAKLKRLMAIATKDYMEDYA